MTGTGKSTFFSTALLAMLCLAGSMTPVEAASRRSRRRPVPKVPVIMEESTVRGKIVVLESRREDRKTVEELLVQVWQAAQEEDDTDGGEQTRPKANVEDKLVHETRTDKDGFFSLPALDVGGYFLVVGQIYLRCSVIPLDPKREGQEEPKILLLLLPKEVV